MAPNHGLVHLKEYDIKDSNVELIGSDIDHQVKYNSAATEPAWNAGAVGLSPGLFIWRIENFAVVPIPKESYGNFFEGDSYIVLHTEEIESQQGDTKLIHDIFFWLGAHTSQDEAGTAAYKTVELDEFLRGAATQHRELQGSPSDDFLALFPRLTVRRGGVASGFRHVEEPTQPDVTTLLRVFKRRVGHGGRDTVVVHEVEPTWRSLDEEDVFILDKGDKILVWQGKGCSPMEKAKAAQVVHDMKLARHVDVEVISQTESRSYRFIKELGGGEEDAAEFHTARPIRALGDSRVGSRRARRLFRLSDASGQLTFELVGEGEAISKSELDSSDVFLLDDGGKEIWVWEGAGASRAEKAMWLKVAQAYVRQLQGEDEGNQAYLLPIANVREGRETTSFKRAIQAV
ncbi:putative actin-binding protein [Podospora aff. communis PSN243]|uniref:Actin-binding protein n=1 Tax=Podospora aff. communis PSN243 TaxID=3040156 RepID=A0AAV9G0V8_9PEZI|nr:putative actin-binding protein [Podospora aff. communis PSN243]